jgi:hypothetical protein
VVLNRGMDSTLARIETRPQVDLAAEVVSYALSQLKRDELATTRRCPGPLPDGWAPPQHSILRHSDEQTIAAAHAVGNALIGMDPADKGSIEDWGVLAAPRYLGRSSLVVALNRFRTEGVWGVSPHLIPHFALHSQAGTISLFLGTHGPNLGIGGGQNAATEGLLAALTWLSSGTVPGIWLVISGWAPELVPDEHGEPIEESECQALALALVRANSQEMRRPILRAVSPRKPVPPLELDLIALAERLRQSGVDSVAGVSPASDRLMFHESHDVAVIPRPHFNRRGRPQSTFWTAATDATGRQTIELLTSQHSRKLN